jgi:hypothetical protein
MSFNKHKVGISRRFTLSKHSAQVWWLFITDLSSWADSTENVMVDTLSHENEMDMFTIPYE